MYMQHGNFYIPEHGGGKRREKDAAMFFFRLQYINSYQPIYVKHKKKPFVCAQIFARYN